MDAWGGGSTHKKKGQDQPASRQEPGEREKSAHANYKMTNGRESQSGVVMYARLVSRRAGAGQEVLEGGGGWWCCLWMSIWLLMRVLRLARWMAMEHRHTRRVEEKQGEQ